MLHGSYAETTLTIFLPFCREDQVRKRVIQINWPCLFNNIRRSAPWKNIESDLDLPATDEPSEDVAGLSLEIGGEKGLGLELTFGIADKEPADRDWRDPSAIPNRRATGDLNEAIDPAIPETDSTAFPGD